MITPSAILNKAAQALFEYENDRGPKGDKWANADYMTNQRYLNKAKIVLDTLESN